MIYQGDTVEVMHDEIEENSFDFSVFSLPFSDLFVYSSEKADMGNCRDSSINHNDPGNRGEFYYNWQFVCNELFRCMKPGTVTAIHLSQLLATMTGHGYIGLRDFYSTVRAGMCKAGFLMFGEFVIKKNQQAVSIRTHASTLTMGTHSRDTSKCAPCFNDFCVLFKKPGERDKPVHPPRFDRNEWIAWASGIWVDIKEGDVLNKKGAKDKPDEKHICPLQLTVIERLTRMYANERETCFTPFMGIGSEPVQFLRLNQIAVGIELKKSYFQQSLKFIKQEASTGENTQMGF